MADTPENDDDSAENGTPERAVMPHDGPVIDIAREMRSSYLDYAMSVIVSRAFPTCATG